jgi:antitoxin PrlF
MKCAVSEKGQVTIPKALRDKLGLKTGTILELETRRGLLIGRKAASGDPILAVTGIVKLDVPIDRYLEELRGGAE